MTQTHSDLAKRPVFISYSHDSPEHSARVLLLADSLRALGVDVELDQYHIRPPAGWPRWCEEQLREENSGFVLMICTKAYRDRVEAKVPPDEGRGVYWEGGLIYSYVYNSKNAMRFIPVLLAEATEADIVRPLRDGTRYRLNSFELNDPGFEALYRELTGQPAVRKRALGEIVNLSSPNVNAPHVSDPRPLREQATHFASAREIWQEKLDYLQMERAKASDPSQIFSIKRAISEAEDKLRELGSKQ